MLPSPALPASAVRQGRTHGAHAVGVAAEAARSGVVLVLALAHAAGGVEGTLRVWEGAWQHRRLAASVGVGAIG